MLVSTSSQRRSVVSLGGMVTACLLSAMLVLTLFPGMAPALASGLTVGRVSAADQLTIEESDSTGTVVCRSVVDASGAASCSSINAFGGASPVTPGGSRVTTLVFTNAGSSPARSFAVDAGTCSQARSGRVSGSATDLCDLFSVELTAAGTTIFRGSVAEFGRADAIDILSRAGVGPVAGGQSIAVTLTLRLSAAADNRHQGLRIVAPIAWTFGA